MRCVDPLRGYGFVPEDVEIVMIGEAALMARDPVLRAGVALRAVTQREDFRRIAGMESRVWGAD